MPVLVTSEVILAELIEPDGKIVRVGICFLGKIDALKALLSAFLLTSDWEQLFGRRDDYTRVDKLSKSYVVVKGNGIFVVLDPEDLWILVVYPDLLFVGTTDAFL